MTLPANENVQRSCARHSSRRSGIEKQCRITSRSVGVLGAAIAIVSSSAARVWMTSGLPVARASSIWARKARALVGARARSRGSSPGRSRRSRGSAGGRRAPRGRRGRRRRSPSASLGWRPIAAKTCGNASAAASAARHVSAVGADGEHPRDARRRGRRHQLGVGGLAGVEVGVGVDHALGGAREQRRDLLRRARGGAAPNAAPRRSRASGAPSAARSLSTVSGR